MCLTRTGTLGKGQAHERKQESQGKRNGFHTEWNPRKGKGKGKGKGKDSIQKGTLGKKWEKERERIPYRTEP